MMGVDTISFFAANRTPAQPLANADEMLADLTERELEILTLIARGEPNAVIAETLMISVKTVRNHVANILGKLQVADRAQAAIRARMAGLS